MATKIEQIADALRDRIIAGDYGKYGRLPSRVELAKQFSTTKETVNKALMQLQGEGLIISKGRAGLMINLPKMRIPGITSAFETYLTELGLTPKSENVGVPELVSLPEEISKIFSVEPGTHAVRRLRRQGTTTTPYRLAENYYPESLAGGDILANMQQDSNLDVLLAIKDKYGKKITNVHEDIIARLPLKTEQELLGVARQAPVIELRRTNTDDDGTVIMYNKIIFIASFFILSYDYKSTHWSK